MKRQLILFLFFLIIFSESYSQKKIIPGADRMEVYVPLLEGKSVAVFANQTSMVHNTNLVDTLIKRGIKVVKIFGPEHGFRGKADAGEKVGNSIDKETGVEVISLYGKHNKPTPEDLQGVDVMIFDIQDVGTRFYTFISSLQYYIEAALENSKPLLILDRPNPNGFYVDGPVLDPKFKSFVGMQPVPIVYGMTIGEYAMMLFGERWLSEKANETSDYYKIAKNSPDTPFHCLVIKCKNYDHSAHYIPPVKPSPNLPDIQSIYWYPSTCFFEATILSEGRGTDKPFQLFGHPSLPTFLKSFTPHSMPGVKEPKFKNQVCYGWDISGTPYEVFQRVNNHIQLKCILQAYSVFPEKDKFFLSATSLNRLAGNDQLEQQIKEGKTDVQIRATWEPALSKFKETRKKYLLYNDFNN